MAARHTPPPQGFTPEPVEDSLLQDVASFIAMCVFVVAAASWLLLL